MIRKTHNGNRGSVLLVVVVFLATAIAGLAAIMSGRVVSAVRDQKVIEDEGRALNSAYAQIHMAMNVVNNSAYDAENHNLELRAAIDGTNGGTIGGTTATFDGANGGESTGYIGESEMVQWLDVEGDPEYGLVKSTNVRVYHARDYIQRLARIKGTVVDPDIDPAGLSDSYFVIEAAGRVGGTIRLVSALVRENEPFSSFVFFQNRATLGVSGAPRGLIHSNEKIAFYFADGNYVDSVSAVDGFEYAAGATTENTNLRDANPEGQKINLEQVDFAQLKTKADLFTGADGLDAEIKMYGDGQLRIKQFTPPYFEQVEKSYTYDQYVGYHYEPYTVIEPVQVGEVEVEYTEQVVDYYVTETYTVIEQVQVGTVDETRTRQVKVKIGEEEVTKYKTVSIYEEQTVTKTRWVQVWESYGSGDGDGGTAVGGDGGGDLGEWVWVQEEYQAQEMVKIGEEQVAYTEIKSIYEWQTEEYIVTVKVYEDQEVTKERQVPVYKTVTKTRMDPVYEDQEVEKQQKVYDYEPVTYTWTEEVWHKPTLVSENTYTLDDSGSTIYIDGRVTKLYGNLKGRLTIVGNEKVRVTGNIRYVDDEGDTAMINGDDYTKSYERNPEYQGSSTLGVIARDDVLYTDKLPGQAEINATLMSVNGRVGIDGFWADPSTGEVYKDSSSARETYLTEEQRETERAYDYDQSYKTELFKKDSLRRIGGIISNNRVLETYIKTGGDGNSYVDSGFKRGNMKFDINLMFNPPPNFVEVPRPVLTYFVPIIMVRNNDA